MSIDERSFFFFPPQIQSRSVLSAYSAPLLCNAGNKLAAWVNSAIYGSFPLADKLEKSPRMFGAIQKIQRKRSFSSEPLLIEKKKGPIMIGEKTKKELSIPWQEQ